MNFSESTVLERVVPEGRAPGTKANFEPHATPAPRLRLDTRRSRWSLKRPLIAAAALLFLAVAAGYGDYYSTTGRFLVSTDDAYVQAHSVLVSPSPTFATRGEASLKRSDFRGRGAARSAPQNGR